MKRAATLLLGWVVFVGVGLPPALSQQTGEKPTSKPTVYAWFPARPGDFGTRAIDWTAITHLSFRAVVIQADGTLKETIPRDRVRKLAKEAHGHGVKLTVLVWGTKPEGSSNYLAKHQDEAVQALVDFVKENNLDGLDMDDETWSETNTVTKGPNRDLVTGFFGKLSRALKSATPGYQIFWASPPVIDRRERYGVAWPDYKAIADLIDGFAIMTYTMCPATIGWTGSQQPISGGGKVNGHARDYLTCIQDYLEATGGKRDKLLLGISNDRGGLEWTCQSGEPLARIIGKPRKLKVDEVRANVEKYGRRFDPLQKAPWYRYPQDGQWVQGWYEDDESLAAKLELARRQRLQGICLWVLDGGKEPASNFQLIHRHLRDGEPRPVLDVWPGKAPGETARIGDEMFLEQKPGQRTVQRLTNVSKPTITIFRPAQDKDTGAAVVICPGGGYNLLAWDLEGEEAAAWLNSLGVTGIVLKYRVPRRPDQAKDKPPLGPLQDAERALSLVRSKASEWKLDAERIGILGFSAGGHLAAAVATNHDKRAYPAIDDVDKVSYRPDFTVLIYPGGLSAKDRDGQLAEDIRVSKETPPMFLVHASNDKAENSVHMYLALKRAGVPAELHVYAAGGHGFGLRRSADPCSTWTDRCGDWLRSQGFLTRRGDERQRGQMSGKGDRVDIKPEPSASADAAAITVFRVQTDSRTPRR